MRQCALSGDADGWRLGLAVLEHRGVAGWLRVRRASCPAPPRPAAQRSPRPVAARAAEELVAVLASMALGALARR